MLILKAFLGPMAVVASGFLLLSGCSHKDVDDNVLKVPLTSNIKGIDPIQADDLYSSQVVSQIYEPLYHYHPLKRPMTVEPNLASGMPEISKDGLTYKIKLLPGIRFQDSEVFPNGKGREVVTQDIVYSWKRLADPSLRSTGFWIFDGKIKGLNEWRDKLTKKEATYDTPIAGLETPDDHTLVIHLVQPYYQLIYVLAQPFASVVPKEAVDKYGPEFTNHPVGTGAFQLTNWVRGNQINLSKNPNFREILYPADGAPGDKELGMLADAGKRIPFVDKLIFYELPEDQPRWLSFLKGQTDIVTVPKDNFDSAVEGQQPSAELRAKGIKNVIEKDSLTSYIGFNMQDPVVGKNLNLRRALNLAINTQVLIDRFYPKHAIAAQSPIPPDIDGYDPNFKNPWREFNVEKAKLYMTKAGFPNGQGLAELEYSCPSDTVSRQLGEFLQQQFAAIGVKLKIVTNSWPQFTEKLHARQVQLFGISWTADYPDAENFLQLLYGPNSSPGPNNSNFNNKDYNALYVSSTKLPPGPARDAIYRKMVDIFVQELPWSVTVHPLRYVFEQGWLMNAKDSFAAQDDIRYWRVDVKKKKELKAKL